MRRRRRINLYHNEPCGRRLAVTTGFGKSNGIGPANGRLGHESTVDADRPNGGTLICRSAESVLGRALDAGSDVCGLGALTDYLLTGQAPFSGDNPAAIGRQVEARAPVASRSANPVGPRDLEDVCWKAAAKDPRARSASAAKFAADLRRFREGRPAHA